MTKEELLKSIAETGYNVGFGAKKHFATFDIVDKTPGWISFASIAFGIYSLIFTCLSTKNLSAFFIILGIMGLYIAFYEPKKIDYCKMGNELAKLYDQLALLYRETKNAEERALADNKNQLKDIQIKFKDLSISKQILFSDWYAHYKFFSQYQIDWIDEQLKFKFFQDKIPLSLRVSLLLIVIAVCLLIFNHHFLLTCK